MWARITRIAAGLLVVVAVFIAGLWAGQTALRPPSDPLTAAEPTTYRVAQGSLSRELSLSATASWQVGGMIRSGFSGTLTTIDIDNGSVVTDGMRLATVNLQPVYLAQGDVPAFRDLGAGAKGADVTSLQRFLRRQGHDPGVIDGVLGSPTVAAIRAWESDTGQEVTGAVALGQLVFTPALPVRVRVVVGVGDAVGQGAELAELLTAPVFSIGVTDLQVGLIPPDAAVSVAINAGAWSAKVNGVDNSQPGSPALILAGVDGGAVCGADCGVVPTDRASVWAADVTLVPQVDGLVVPVSALRTEADGSRSVLTADGADHPVQVIASNGGLAVIEGVADGTVITLPSPER